MPTVKEVIKHLKSYKPDEHIATAIWSEEDVLERAMFLEVKISREEAGEILDEIDRKQDCELGVSWATLDVFIQDYRPVYDKHDQASQKHPMYPAPVEERG